MTDAEYHSGCKAARDRVNGLANTTADRRKVAGHILDVEDFDTTDEFYRGYMEQLAQWSHRLCRWCRAVFDEPNRWDCCPSCLSREYADGENLSIEDLAQTIDLDDSFELQTLISQDGRAVLWVCDKSRPDENCKGREFPAHERLGKLDNETRWRILRSRCGRPTKSGRPCRNTSPCRYHR
jgi:hypothetical protein